MPYSNKQILVVEDELLLAMELEDAIVAAGHECIGPASTFGGAFDLLARERCHAAILDIVIAGQRVDPICEELERRGIPFGFATGMKAAEDVGPWATAPRIVKPYTDADLRGLIDRLLGAS